jgi:hypothetical protein
VVYFIEEGISTSVAILCITLGAYTRVAHGDYMPIKIDGRLIGLVLSSQSTIVHLRLVKHL